MIPDRHYNPIIVLSWYFLAIHLFTHLKTRSMPVYDLNRMNQEEIVPGFRVQFVHSDNMTIAFFEIEKGAILPEHSHPHEQVSEVIKGELELSIDGATEVLKPGKIAVIPSHVPHGVKALTKCLVKDIFQPVREEYLKKKK
jgi:quercetin dioxygenase-like cupin family protein